jgi:hypothetical protein
VRSSLNAASRFSVYDGRSLIGTIRARKKQFEARDARRRSIGKFKTLTRAADAISDRAAAPGVGARDQ